MRLDLRAGRIRSWWRGLRERVRHEFRANLDPGDVGVAVGLGTFIGCLPIFGLHLPVCIALARRFRLNPALVYGAANISNPFFAPFLIAAEIAIGQWILGFDPSGTVDTVERPIWESLRQAPDLVIACGVGGLVLGAVLGLVLGFLAWAAAWRWARRALTEAESPGGGAGGPDPEEPERRAAGRACGMTARARRGGWMSMRARARGRRWALRAATGLGRPRAATAGGA